MQQAAPVDPRDNRRAGASGQSADPGKPAASRLGAKQLTPAEEKQVAELAQIDRRVRAHEAAHQAAAGSMGGAASYSFETGPDGKSYAVGGEVPVDLSSGRTPEETIAKAQQVRSAALAPADPSPQDLSVAAEASQMEAMARAELIRQQLEVESAARAVGVPRASARDDAAGSRPTAGVRPTGQGSSAQADVGAQALATVSALQAERAVHGASQAQVQHIARLAASAYERM